MSFLRSPITAGPVLTGIFSYQSHCFCVFVFVYIYIFSFLSLVTAVLATLSSGADWWIIDKQPSVLICGQQKYIKHKK